MLRPNFLNALVMIAGLAATTAGGARAQEPAALTEGFQALQQRNAAAAVAAFQPLADAGHKRALYGLGLTYLELGGCAVGKDCRKVAVPLIQGAAEAGDPDAASLLGLWFQNGSLDQPKDLTQSLHWYEAAGRGGVVSALIEIGVVCEDGAPQCRPDQAAKAYERASAMGNPYAAFRLGEMYRLGRQAPKNADAAARYYALAAEQGWAEAQVRLADAYLVGEGVAQDERQGRVWYERAAARGLAGGAVGLAKIYREGLGVTIDAGKALSLLQQALNAPETQDRLGNDFREAKAKAARMAAEMCGKDPQAPARRALIHTAARYQQADAIKETLADANAGDPGAQAVLGQLFLWRQDGARDPATAFNWLRRAAEQGQVNAMYWLASAYKLGWGTEPDDEAAYRWLAIAHPRAKGWQRTNVDDDLPSARRALTPEQRKQIDAQAEKWSPKYERPVPASSPPRGCLFEPPGTRFAWKIAG